MFAKLVVLIAVAVAVCITLLGLRHERYELANQKIRSLQRAEQTCRDIREQKVHLNQLVGYESFRQSLNRSQLAMTPVIQNDRPRASATAVASNQRPVRGR